jgi:hypothetical protein
MFGEGQHALFPVLVTFLSAPIKKKTIYSNQTCSSPQLTEKPTARRGAATRQHQTLKSHGVRRFWMFGEGQLVLFPVLVTFLSAPIKKKTIYSNQTCSSPQLTEKPTARRGAATR